MICALKEIGGPIVVYDVPDPAKLFTEHCGDEAKVTHISGQTDGLAVLTHVTPDLDDGINMQVGGTLFYGMIVFVCTDANDTILPLTSQHIEQLKSCAKVVYPEGEMG